MAACGSLRHIFENTIPENNSSSSSSSTSSLIDSLSSSWKQIKPLKPTVDHHSLTEIFGELHFKENHQNPISLSSSSSASSSSSSSSSAFFTPPLTSSSTSATLPIESIIPESNVNQENEKSEGYKTSYHRKSDSFSSLNSDSLLFCTEGLGSESMYDVDDLENIVGGEEGEKVHHHHHHHHHHVRRHSGDSYSYCRNKRGNNGRTTFPPPISYIGQTGKPSVSFQSYRQNGRFVLKEIRIPTQECLQASREDGRLRLSFVQNDDDDDDVDEDEDDYGGEEEEEESGELGGFERIEEEDEKEDDDVMEEDEGMKV